jgi:hypothetical protein
MSRGKGRIAAVLLAVAMAVGGTIWATAASADPSHNIQQPVNLTCDNGTSFVVNPGTVTNRSHQAFVVSSTSILVAKYLAFTDANGTQVFFDTAQGLEGLVTCTGDAGGGFTITVRGFFTPRS